VRVRFCGVRGSTPVDGPEFAQVGGHTSCIAISVDDELPSLVLDAGTGLQVLGPVFGSEPFIGTILLSHLHWDHVQGLPFFPPSDRDDAEVVVAQPAQGDAYEVMAQAMSPPHFPIMPDGLRGSWEHVGLEAGEHRVGKFSVVAHDVEHKGGRAFGFRVSTNGSSLAYVPDALDDNDDAILALASDVDVFVRGAPYLTSECERADLFGHGTVEHTVEVAARAGARELIITHHAPYRTDLEVAQIAAAHGITAAHDGMVIVV